MDEEVMTDEELRGAVEKIFKRSQTDPEFRKLCLSKPEEAIRALTGKAVPAGTRIRFLDSPPGKTEEPGGAAT